MPPRTVVAFDLDGTLTRRDTLLPFLRRTCGVARTCQALLAQSVPLVRSLAGVASRDEVKAAVLGPLLRGRSVTALEKVAEEFAVRVVSRGMRPEMVERVGAHRRAGHDLVIVSASPEIYVRPLARELQIDNVLATRLEVDGAGRLTGRLEGFNCRGSEKVARLRDWLSPDGSLSWAYGNSQGDRELLAQAEHRVHVGHGRRLPPLGADLAVD